MKTVLIFLLLWIMLVGFAYVASNSALQISETEDFARRGISTPGKITKFEPKEVVYFEYEVSGKPYTETGYFSGEPGFESLRAGQEINVLYIPENPEVSFIGDPKVRLEYDYAYRKKIIIFFPLASLIPAFLLYLIVKKNTKRVS